MGVHAVHCVEPSEHGMIIAVIVLARFADVYIQYIFANLFTGEPTSR